MNEDISHIFRSYDVRGIYGKDLDESIMERIGNAFAQHTRNNVTVACDMRIHSAALCNAFISGLLAAGMNVTFLGVLPLGVGMFHAWKKQNYAYITASHLPKEWNGVKLYHENGVGFFENENFAVRDIVISNNILKSKSRGNLIKENTTKVTEDYKKYILSKVKAKKKLEILLDTGNGCAGLVARDLFTRAGFAAKAVYEELDGTFPNRNPEPSEDPLTALKKHKGLGIAYDGDGDRMLLVYDGVIIQPEQTAYIILSELLKKEKGPIVANIECTRLIDDVAKKFQRDVVRVPVGHTFLVQEVFKNNACFGIELSGHYIIPSLMPVDDSLAVSLYTASIISTMDNFKGVLDKIPKYPFKRINFDCSDKIKFRIIEKIKSNLKRNYKNVSTMDGVRVDLPNGWALIRASNTTPLIRLSIEASSEADLQKLKKEFTEIIEKELG